MQIELNDQLECAGRAEDGFPDSWWDVVVRGLGPNKKVTVEYLTLTDGNKPLKSKVAISRLRPRLEDDSVAVPLSNRHVGDAVDCYYNEGWWGGFIHQTYDDHVTVYFPATPDEAPYRIYAHKQHLPGEKRIRTSKVYDAARECWKPKAKQCFQGSANRRTGAQAVLPDAAASSSSESASAGSQTPEPAGRPYEEGNDDASSRQPNLAGARQAPAGAAPAARAALPEANGNTASHTGLARQSSTRDRLPAATSASTLAYAASPPAQAPTAAPASKPPAPAAPVLVADDGDFWQPALPSTKPGKQARQENGSRAANGQASDKQVRGATAGEQAGPGGSKPRAIAASQAPGLAAQRAAAAGPECPRSAGPLASPETSPRLVQARPGQAGGAAAMVRKPDGKPAKELKRTASKLAPGAKLAPASKAAPAGRPDGSKAGGQQGTRPWSEQEVETLIRVLRTHGRNFAKAQEQLVDRSMGDIREFYYGNAKQGLHLEQYVSKPAGSMGAPPGEPPAAQPAGRTQPGEGSSGREPPAGQQPLQRGASNLSTGPGPRSDPYQPGNPRQPASSGVDPLNPRQKPVPSLHDEVRKSKRDAHGQLDAPRAPVVQSTGGPESSMQRRVSDLDSAMAAAGKVAESKGDSGQAKAQAPPALTIPKLPQDAPGQSPPSPKLASGQGPTCSHKLDRPQPADQSSALGRNAVPAREAPGAGVDTHASETPHRADRTGASERSRERSPRRRHVHSKAPTRDSSRERTKKRSRDRSRERDGKQPGRSSRRRSEEREGQGPPAHAQQTGPASRPDDTRGADRAAAGSARQAAAQPAHPATAHHTAPPAGQSQPDLAVSQPAQRVLEHQESTNKRTLPEPAPRPPTVASDVASKAPARAAAATEPGPPPAKRRRVEEPAWADVVHGSDPARGHILCLDNIGGMGQAALHDALAQHLPGLVEVRLADVELDVGIARRGWAALQFKSPTAAAMALDKLGRLYVCTGSSPLPRPLIAHRPRFLAYPWGDQRGAPWPGHLSVGPDFLVTPHFMQPNSIEFDMGVKWRALQRCLDEAKGRLVKEHTSQLAALMREYVQESGREVEVAAYLGAQADVPPPPPPLPSACLWLRAVPPGECLGGAQHPEGDLQRITNAFWQFSESDPLVTVARDPVTGRGLGSAIVRLADPQHAQRVVRNLTDMLFVLLATPRPVEASLARAGAPQGSMAVYDAALRQVFGRDDAAPAGGGPGALAAKAPLELVEFAPPGGSAEQRAALELRRLLTEQGLTMQALAEEAAAQRRQLADRQQEQFGVEQRKLEDLADLGDHPLVKQIAGTMNLRWLDHRRRRGAAAPHRAGGRAGERGGPGRGRPGSEGGAQQHQRGGAPGQLAVRPSGSARRLLEQGRPPGRQPTRGPGAGRARGPSRLRH